MRNVQVFGATAALLVAGIIVAVYHGDTPAPPQVDDTSTAAAEPVAAAPPTPAAKAAASQPIPKVVATPGLPAPAPVVDKRAPKGAEDEQKAEKGSLDVQVGARGIGYQSRTSPTGVTERRVQIPTTPPVRVNVTTPRGVTMASNVNKESVRTEEQAGLGDRITGKD